VDSSSWLCFVGPIYNSLLADVLQYVHTWETSRGFSFSCYCPSVTLIVGIPDCQCRLGRYHHRMSPVDSSSWLCFVGPTKMTSLLADVLCACMGDVERNRQKHRLGSRGTRKFRIAHDTSGDGDFHILVD
jgi:hypothetical protein